MKITKIILTTALTLMLSATVLAAAPYKSLYYDGANHPYTADKINLIINGEKLDDSNLPIQAISLDGSRTLVPLREVLEAAGATVNFDNSTNKVTVLDGNNTVVVTVGSTTGYINGSPIEMDAAPKYVSTSSTGVKKVMIPLRFVGEGLGYEVVYDAATRTVKVDKPATSTTPTIEVKLTEVNSSSISSVSGTTSKITKYTLPTETNKSFVLEFDSPVANVKKTVLADGRLVVDIENSILTTKSLNNNLSVGTLSNVRLAQFATTPTPISRAVLTFSGDSSYTVTLSENRKTLTISFESAGNTPVAPKEKNNATGVAFSKGTDTDLFSIYGETEAPELYSVTAPDDSTLYIDIVRPNTILSNATNNQISETVSGLATTSYKIYDLDETRTRIVVTLDKKCITNVIVNGNTTKVFIKPNANITPGGTPTVGTEGALTLTSTERTATLKISKTLTAIPAGYNIENITHTDNYMAYQYVLLSPFDLKKYISTQNLVVNNEILKSIDIVNVDSKTKFVFNGSTVLHATVTEDANSIIFTINAARDVYDKIIVIDAGHGGTDPGTSGVLSGTTYYEKTVALDMAKQASSLISADTRFKVYQTRPLDVFTQLYDRPAFSTNVKADMFISIHANASTSTVPMGIDTFYFDVTQENATYLATKGVYPTDYRKSVTAKSKAFAEAMQTNIINSTNVIDRKYKHADFAVLRQNEIPAILIETGFMTNYVDMTNLANPEFRTKIAKAIADTVIANYNNY